MSRKLYKLEEMVIGNCASCYYSTRLRKDGSCVCLRYPKWVDVSDMDKHICGEYKCEQSLAGDYDGIKEWR